MSEPSSPSPVKPSDVHAQEWTETRSAMKLSPAWGVLVVLAWIASPMVVIEIGLLLTPELAVQPRQTPQEALTADWWGWWEVALRTGIALAAILLARFAFHQPMRCVGLDQPRLGRDARFLALMLAGAGGVFVALVGVIWLLFSLGMIGSSATEAGQDQSFLEFMRALSMIRDFSWGNAIILVIYAPIIEEVIFRGWLYTQLRTTIERPWLWIIVTALVFGFAHNTSGVPVSQLIGGVVFAYAYERTRQLYVPIILHIAGNGSLFAISWLVSG